MPSEFWRMTPYQLAVVAGVERKASAKATLGVDEADIFARMMSLVKQPHDQVH
jgi:hypothetical protein